MLSDREIESAILRKRIGVTPYEPELLQPNSLDMRLDNHWMYPNHAVKVIDLANVRPGHMVPYQRDRFALQPGCMVLGSSREVYRIPEDVVARVEGKSSLARLGLVVHATAGFIDSGFEGQITLEFINHGPWTIILHENMTVAQIAFQWTLPVRKTYQGRYQGQRGPVESRYRGVPRA